MGQNVAGIIIKVNPSKFNISTFANQYFSNHLEVGDLYCDTRKSGNFCFIKTPEFLIIENSDFAKIMMHGLNERSHKDLFHYVDKEDLLMAFEMYTHSDSVGFATFENGKLKRLFQAADGLTIHEKGPILDLELKWRNAKRFQADVGDGHFIPAVYNPDNPTQEVYLYQYPYYILQELLEKTTGFNLTSLYDSAVEYKYVKLKASYKTIWERLKSLRFLF